MKVLGSGRDPRRVGCAPEGEGALRVPRRAKTEGEWWGAGGGRPVLGDDFSWTFQRPDLRPERSAVRDRGEEFALGS